MGTIKKGILGGFSGKVGTVIGANWRGLDVMRSLPKKSKSLPTPTQLEQRLRFGLAIKFLSPIKALIDKAYGTAEGTRSKFNLAMSYHVQEAVTGTMPDLTLDFSKVLFAKGDLLGPWAPTVAVPQPATELVFAWQPNADTGLSNEDDQAVVLVYNPMKQLYIISEGEAYRRDRGLGLKVPAVFTGDEVHCWMSFISADGKQVATSVYLGPITVN